MYNDTMWVVTRKEDDVNVVYGPFRNFGYAFDFASMSPKSSEWAVERVVPSREGLK